MKLKKPLFLLPLLFLGLLIGITFGREEANRKEKALFKENNRTNPFIERIKNDFRFQYRLFKKAVRNGDKFTLREGRYLVTFTVRPDFQNAVKKIFKKFKVKYGAYVAIDPETGKVMAAVSSTDVPDLTLKNSYPTASTFKIITAAAALDKSLADSKTVLQCGGLGDSCSPYVWLNSSYRRERVFDRSFATSANPFFGNLGRLLGKAVLLEYAKRFGFNSRIYNFPWGILREPLDDYELAATAAGLGDVTTSPFHQAVIAQTIESGGIMMKPFIVESVFDLKQGKEIFRFEPKILRKVISKDTADKLKKMMLLTPKVGTVSDKRYFKRLSYKFPELKIGGKTGTLSEISFPEGRCEWFTGFLELNGKKLAFSSVAVNGWTYYISGYEISAVAAEEFVKLERKKGGERCASSAR